MRPALFLLACLTLVACEREPPPPTLVAPPPTTLATTPTLVAPPPTTLATRPTLVAPPPATLATTPVTPSAASTQPIAAAPPPPRKPATPMSAANAAWLERPGRDARQRPEHVLDVIGVQAGMTVADVGCGSGYFSVRLARRVGPAGHVLATDIQPAMLALLAKKIRRSPALANITPILATDTDVSLPRGAVDIALMVDVYHELAHPRETVAQIRDALRPGGELVLVEYRGEDPEVDIPPAHKMTLAQLRAEMDQTDFVFVSSDESLPEQRIVTFRPR